MIYIDTDSMKTLRVGYIDFLLAKASNQDDKILELECIIDTLTDNNNHTGEKDNSLYLLSFLAFLITLSLLVALYIYFNTKLAKISSNLSKSQSHA